MDQETIRSFLAIELSNEAKNEAFSFIEKIEKNYLTFRFIPHQNWHLTLHFFGEISLAQVDQLHAELPKVLTKIQPFTISLYGIGAFPSNQRPRILWIGVSGDLARLSALKHNIDQVLKKIDLQIESANYHPHVTIARVRKNEKALPLKVSQEFKGQAISHIDHITLFKSVLAPQGAKYEPLLIFSFGGI